MLHYAVVFFVVALIAAVLGARGVAGMWAQIGYLLVVIAVIFLVVSVVTGGAPAVGAPLTDAAMLDGFSQTTQGGSIQ